VPARGAMRHQEWSETRNPEGSKRLVIFVTLNGGRVNRRRAAGTLWPCCDDVCAAGNLRCALWRLRVTGSMSCAEIDACYLHPELSVPWMIAPLPEILTTGVPPGRLSSSKIFNRSLSPGSTPIVFLFVKIPTDSPPGAFVSLPSIQRPLLLLSG
jgi:hypothetical protein